MEYVEINHPKYESLAVKQCYLCGKDLDGPTNKDHIIPNTMFPKWAGYRPQLLVHKICNTGKSMIDERFKGRVLLMTSLNPTASTVLYRDFLKPSNDQMPYVNIPNIGNKIRDYKLVKTLAKDFEKESDMIHNGEKIVTIRSNKKHTSELNSYAYKMAQGLFIRNIPWAKPRKPKLTWIDATYLDIMGEPLKNSIIPVKNLITNAKAAGSLFGQSWPGHISYFGSESSDIKNTGFVWISFYDRFGVLAFFRPQKLKSIK
jgi:hypothetical protein